MPASPATPAPGSFLLLEDLFERQDDGFVDELRRHSDAKRLQAFAERWRKDARPWARAQVARYLEAPLDRPGHEPVVKRLFKEAEERRDEAQMGAFLRAFDRLVRRRRRPKWDWDPVARRALTREVLKAPRDALLRGATQMATNPRTGVREPFPVRQPKEGRLFRYHTRHYLRRRAWRFFRRIGFRAPERYAAALAPALARYEEDDLAKGEHLLDSWGLLRALFGKHPALVLGRAYANLAEGRTMADLAPAPRFAAEWRRPEALPPLLSLALEGRAHLVRAFAVEVLRRDHRDALSERADGALLLRLLESEDADVRRLGAELVETAACASKLSVTAWLALLGTRDAAALELVAGAMRRHVRPDRLDLAQAVLLATAAPAPVARLGLEVLAKRTIAGPEERSALARLADARCLALGGEIARFALERIGGAGVYDRDGVTALLDASLESVRRGALAWLESEAGKTAADDPVLFARLFESPYPEIRERLVRLLEKLAAARNAAQGAASDPRATLWATVLLGVHRGNRAKHLAIRQLGDELARDPARAPDLLPVLAVAVRSSRGAERRAGLAAALAALERRADLRDALARALPELTVSEAEAVL